MNRALRQGVMLIVGLVFAGAAGAQTRVLSDDVAANDVAASAPRQAAQQPQETTPLSGTPLPSMGAEEPRQLPSTEVHGYREAPPQKCDRAHGAGSTACRAQLAARYAEMDRMCRIVSPGTELPVCIKSAYAAD